MTATAPVPPPEVADSAATLRAFLHGLPAVDQAGVEARAAALATRSVKGDAKRRAIDLAIRMIDLTTLEGSDTPGKVRALCAQAVRPDPADPACPAVAAVCVYPAMVATAAEALAERQPLAGPPVRLASVATAFPAGQAPLAGKLAETGAAIRDGADEIDMVISRGAFLAGRYRDVYQEIRAVREVCDSAPGRPRRHRPHLKVILETGELGGYDNVRRAAWLAMLAGADFIKTSTGKVRPAATRPVTLVMLESARAYRAATGRQVGVKPAGGIRTTKDAIGYLVLVHEVVGEDWLDPAWFRFGASALLTDLLMQRIRMRTGRYCGPDYVTQD